MLYSFQWDGRRLHMTNDMMYLVLIVVLVLSLLALIAKRSQSGVKGFKSLITPILSYLIGIVILLSFYTHTFGPWTFYVCTVLFIGALFGIKSMRAAMVEAAQQK